MSSNYHRILLHITMLSGNDPAATQKANSTYLRFNNILTGDGHLPNISKICEYCDNVNKKLGAYIRNKCLRIRKEDSIFDPEVTKANSMLNIIERSERGKIRIIIYPGKRNDLDNLNMQETTHNMIVQFVEGIPCFNTTEPHKHTPPSFYQCCPSEETALLYFEALLVDACICHYLGISDVAYHHDTKQQISAEKVLFLKEISQNGTLNFLSRGAQQLVKHVLSKLHSDTPYISFLSIFTIAPFDVFGESFKDSMSFFEDYCNLWNEFQKWYFKRHGRLFVRHEKINNPLDMVLDRIKYKGQLSPYEITDKLVSLLEMPICRTTNAPFGEENRFAIIIISHMPDTASRIEEFEALFSGKLHQAKWDIIYWEDIERYNNILDYLEIIPIMIIDQS